MLAQLRYDAQGRRDRLTRGNGAVTEYGYDGVSRLQRLKQDLAGTAHDATFAYEYNPASQIARREGDNDLYAYTAIGSGTATSPSDGLNRMTALGATPLSYDARGNQTTEGTNGLSYSSENLLTGVTLPGAGTVPLVHDPLGRYTRAGTFVRFLYDGDRLVGEHNLLSPSSYPPFKIVHGPGVDEPLVSIGSFGDKVWLHADERGSIVAGSKADGTRDAINSYDEYGRIGGNQAYRHQYAGQPTVIAGIMNSKARNYLPIGGRFLQTDPIGYGDGPNWYVAFGGDPVNVTDPSGLAGRRSSGDAGFILGSLVELGIGLWAADDGAGRARAHQRFEDRMRALAPDLAVRTGATRTGSTLRPGPHAAKSIPARGPESHFNPEERSATNSIGRDTGCYTCGAKNPGTKSGNHVPDHQPPSALAKPREKQSLYPHCIGCSRKQGGEVRQEINRERREERKRDD